MTKEQLKMWMKIIGFVILLAFGGLIIAGIVDGTGFVYDYFYVPFLFVIPLLFIIPIVILYVIYMFVEKGEALRIIANILACVLAVYVVGGVSLLRHSEFMNSYRYKALESSAYQIVSNIFEDSTIEKDDSFFYPMHQSLGDMMVYEGDTIRYNIIDDRNTLCSINLDCVDNYILGTNRIVKDFEEDGFFDISNWNSYDDEIVFEDTGNGEIDGIKYKWSYGELIEDYSNEFFDFNENYITKGIFMFTYKNSIYVATVRVSSDETIHINMETEAEKIVDVIKSMHIFSDYESNEPDEHQTTTESQITDVSNENATEESATPLTEEELKELYTNAHNLYAEWLCTGKNLVVDWDKTTKINDREYFAVKSTEITTVEALKMEFAKYFDSEEIDKIIDEYYVMYNGKMYGDAILVEGGYVPAERYTLTVKKNTNTECVLTITSHIFDSKEEMDYHLKVIDGKWKFTGVFHCVTMEKIVLE